MIRIIKCDFNNPIHNQKVIQLLDAYMQDPMGGGLPMPEYTRENLISGLSNHPSAFVLFALKDDNFSGMITCFINFSTFKAKPFINVHDIVVLKAYRGLGIGRAMLEEVIRMSVDNDYGKITLEVRNDNINAQGLYQSLGFGECDPPMHFWEKSL